MASSFCMAVGGFTTSTSRSSTLTLAELWMVAADGGIFSFGDAGVLGELAVGRRPPQAGPP